VIHSRSGVKARVAVSVDLVYHVPILLYNSLDFIELASSSYVDKLFRAREGAGLLLQFCWYGSRDIIDGPQVIRSRLIIQLLQITSSRFDLIIGRNPVSNIAQGRQERLNECLPPVPSGFSRDSSSGLRNHRGHAPAPASPWLLV